MNQSILRLGPLSLLAFMLAGCAGTNVFSQNETYSQSEICRGIKRQMIVNSHNNNLSGQLMRGNIARLQQQYEENNCGG